MRRQLVELWLRGLSAKAKSPGKCVGLGLKKLIGQIGGRFFMVSEQQSTISPLLAEENPTGWRDSQG
jgi:hypothetical protein